MAAEDITLTEALLEDGETGKQAETASSTKEAQEGFKPCTCGEHGGKHLADCLGSSCCGAFMACGCALGYATPVTTLISSLTCCALTFFGIRCAKADINHTPKESYGLAEDEARQRREETAREFIKLCRAAEIQPGEAINRFERGRFSIITGHGTTTQDDHEAALWRKAQENFDGYVAEAFPGEVRQLKAEIRRQATIPEDRPSSVM